MRRDQLETPESIQKKIMFYSIVDTPGMILVGLGLHAKFSKEGEALLPFLNNPNNTNIAIGVGAAIVAFCMIKIIKLSLKRKKLLDKE